MTGIYIHIPFCEKKCNYCDFNSYAGKQDLMQSYVDRLCGEMKQYAHLRADTLYIGGGTPTSLSAELLEKVLLAAFDTFQMEDGAEVTCEVNPGTATDEKLAALRGTGVNRLSIGVQSFCDSELETLGRIHTAAQAKETVLAARRAGFSNISVDVMFGTPDQTMESWRKTLDGVLALSPEHISAYSMILEENTPFWSMDLNFPDEDTEREMHWEAVRRFQEAGFEHYEISNFAKPGFAARHNVKYWVLEDYVGLGAGACSYFGGERYANVSDISEYINKADPSCHRHAVTEEERKKDAMLLGFRLIGGVAEQPGFADTLKELSDEGLIIRENGTSRLSRRGIDLANQVFMEFV